MKRRLLAGLFLTAVLLSGCLFQPVGVQVPPAAEESSAVVPEASVEEEPEPPLSSSSEEPSEPLVPEPVTIRVKAVGDNLIHSSIYEQAHARAGGEGYDYRYAYENVAGLLGDADISSINQESIIAPAFGPSTYPCFNATAELGDLMLEYGFDVFNLANNHCLDKGEAGVFSSLDYWAERPQAVTTGVYRDEEDYGRIRTIEEKGVTFSFIGVTELTNGLSLPAGSEAVILLGEEEERIEARVREAADSSDVVVVNIHWGNEYTFTPTERQRYLAGKLVEWGADIIIGHHPHVLQPMEYLDKPDGGKALVAYSLGNFISAQDRGARMIGGLLDLDVTWDFGTGTGEITRCELIPLVTHYDQGFRNNRLYALSDYTEELAASHGVRAYSPEFSLEYIKNTVREVVPEEFLENMS